MGYKKAFKHTKSFACKTVSLYDAEEAPKTIQDLDNGECCQNWELTTGCPTAFLKFEFGLHEIDGIVSVTLGVNPTRKFSDINFMSLNEDLVEILTNAVFTKLIY